VTLLLLLIAGIAVLVVVGLVMTGATQPSMPDVGPDRPGPALPEDAPVLPRDINEVRFGLALRGYRMDEVDDVLDRLAAEIGARDALIAELQSQLTGPRDDGGYDDVSSHPATPAAATPPTVAAAVDAQPGDDNVWAAPRYDAVSAGAPGLDAQPAELGFPEEPAAYVEVSPAADVVDAAEVPVVDPPAAAAAVPTLDNRPGWTREEDEYDDDVPPPDAAGLGTEPEPPSSTTPEPEPEPEPEPGPAAPQPPPDAGGDAPRTVNFELPPGWPFSESASSYQRRPAAGDDDSSE
jgi:DivIVA domain-containing protein